MSEPLVARLESWAAWCHERNLKSELQRDLNLAADRIAKLEAERDQLCADLSGQTDRAVQVEYRAETAEAALERVRELLFGTDEPLTYPVDVEKLNRLFADLREAMFGKVRIKEQGNE